MTPNKITPIIAGTAVMTLTGIIPIINIVNLLCCAGIIAGGYAGVYTYWKQMSNAGLVITSKDGGMIGILCGILSAIFVTGFGLLISLFSEVNPMEEVLKSFDELGFALPPEMSQYTEKFSNEFSEYGFSPTITLVTFITNMIIYPLFGSIGAIIGVTVLNKKTTPKI